MCEPKASTTNKEYCLRHQVEKKATPQPGQGDEHTGSSGDQSRHVPQQSQQGHHQLA